MKMYIRYRQLAYCTTADLFDQQLQVSKRILLKCLYKFGRCVIEINGPEYLRNHTKNDVERFYHTYEAQHGCLGMLFFFFLT